MAQRHITKSTNFQLSNITIKNMAQIFHSIPNQQVNSLFGQHVHVLAYRKFQAGSINRDVQTHQVLLPCSRKVAMFAFVRSASILAFGLSTNKSLDPETH